ncbi:hypothetical protein Taro_053628 [Colocasia esculenta]|uniref:Longin domain-containing protein n=1 Tax=Colocasia esculenta TaxID=4460 RepID=A0A843XNP0_COLES|nr:hypothetical protein [Colocasia esculenta]
MVAVGLQDQEGLAIEANRIECGFDRDDPSSHLTGRRTGRSRIVQISLGSVGSCDPISIRIRSVPSDPDPISILPSMLLSSEVWRLESICLVMVKLTMIARVTDGLPLAEGLDDGRDLRDADFYKQQAKLLFKNLSKGQNEASRMSIETGPYLFQYPLVFASFIRQSKTSA